MEVLNLFRQILEYSACKHVLNMTSFANEKLQSFLKSLPSCIYIYNSTKQVHEGNCHP